MATAGTSLASSVAVSSAFRTTAACHGHGTVSSPPDVLNGGCRYTSCVLGRRQQHIGQNPHAMCWHCTQPADVLGNGGRRYSVASSVINETLGAARMPAAADNQTCSAMASMGSILCPRSPCGSSAHRHRWALAEGEGSLRAARPPSWEFFDAAGPPP
jgi:hypothetical protein